MVTYQDYDAVPYEDCPLAQTSPNNLFIIADLFGLQACPPENCRVLEIGCASGGNIIPLAYHWRESNFVGVELSQKQAQFGNKLIDQLKLPNVKIIQADVANLDANLGEFDYIIAHGLFSWVPAETQARIFALIEETLAPNGLVYISYNVLPGWHLRRAVREMMLYHAGNSSSPEVRRDKGKEFLAMLAAGLPDNSSLSEKWIKQEANMLLARSPSYLLHDYLEQNNNPCYFSQFMQWAESHNLQYLAEADLYTMLGTTLTDQAQSMLDKIDDLIEYEQYLDFFYVRYFRQTLLCREGLNINREFNLESICKYFFTLLLRSDEEVDLHKVIAQTFTHPDGTQFKISHPMTKAAVVELSCLYPNSLSYPDLVRRVRQILQESASEFASASEDEMLHELFNLFISQGMKLVKVEKQIFSDVSERPVASDLTRIFADNERCCVGTIHQDSIVLDVLDRYLLTLLDGNRTRDQVCAAVFNRANADGEFRQAIGGQEKDEATFRQVINSKIDRSFYYFAMNGLLSE